MLPALQQPHLQCADVIAWEKILVFLYQQWIHGIYKTLWFVFLNQVGCSFKTVWMVVWTLGDGGTTTREGLETLPLTLEKATVKLLVSCGDMRSLNALLIS